MSNDKCACGAPLVNGGCGNLIFDLNKYLGNEVSLPPPEDLNKKLEAANKRIAELEAELDKRKMESYSREEVKDILIQKFKACADVTFIPKTT